MNPVNHQKGFTPHHFCTSNKCVLQGAEETKGGAGFIALYLSILVLTTLGAFGGTLFLMSFRQESIVRNLVLSSQAYYASESGVEDALLRLKKGWSWTNPMSFSLAESSVQTTISDSVGGARTIVGQGTKLSRTKKSQAVYSISSDNSSFFFGAHVGDGGVVMNNLSKVVGNIFATGSVEGSSGAVITGTVKVAGLGTRIKGTSIQGDAYTDRCEQSSITGTLYANTQTGCTYGSYTNPLSPPIDHVPLPITKEQIDFWKQAAEAGGVITGTYALSGSQIASLGPKKIVGNLTLENFAQLTVTGILWVTGNIILKNESILQLSSSYGSLSGMIVAEGVISLQNNSISRGSGGAGSYAMYLSTSPLDSAIAITNNAQADILYTSAGGTSIENNAKVKEITAYKLMLKNNAILTYEVGLQDVSFTSGPGGSFQVKDWKEIE